MKTCSKCKVEKDVSAFSKNRRKKDGLRPECKACQAETNRKEYSKNKESRAETSRKWQAENKERHRELSRNWVASNKERVAETGRKWYEDNKERRLGTVRTWRQAHPDKLKAYCAKRRAQKKEALCDCCTLTEMAAYYERCPEEYHVDHIQSLHEGGAHCIRNMQYLEAHLNLKKGTKNIIYL